MKKINISMALLILAVSLSPIVFAKSGSSHHDGHSAAGQSRSEEHANSAADANKADKDQADNTSKKRGVKKAGGICFSCVHG